MKLKRYGPLNENAAPYPEDLTDLPKESVIYCIGAGEVIAHAIAISKKLDRNAYIIDPTPHVINHVKKNGGSQLITIPCAVGCENSLKKFYKPNNEDSCKDKKNNFDHSLLEDLNGNPEYIYVQVKTVKSIMKDLGHKKLGILEMDLGGPREVEEGIIRIPECEALEDLMLSRIFPKYISVDLDFGFKKSESISSYGVAGNYAGDKKAISARNKCLKTIHSLEKNNYRVIYNSSENYTFMKS